MDAIDEVIPESAITNQFEPFQINTADSPKVGRTIWFVPVPLEPQEVTVIFAT